MMLSSQSRHRPPWCRPAGRQTLGSGDFAGLKADAAGGSGRQYPLQARLMIVLDGLFQAVLRETANSRASAATFSPSRTRKMNLTRSSITFRLLPRHATLPRKAKSATVLRYKVEPMSQERTRLRWLGWEDSNLRMAESKSAALPLGYTPNLLPPDMALRDLPQ